MKLALTLALLLLSTGVFALSPSDVAFWSDLGEGSGTAVSDSGIYGNDGFLTGASLAWDAADVPSTLPNSIGIIPANADAIVYPSNAITSVGEVGQDYTVSVWFKTSVDQYAALGIYGQYDYATNPGANNPNGRYPYSANMQENGKVGLANYDGAVNPFELTGFLADGEWHHVVFVRDGVNQEITGYIDGKKAMQFADTTSVSLVQPTDIFFGFNPASQAYFDGKIAQPILLTTALGKNEVKRLYNHGEGRTYEQIFRTEEVPEFSAAGAVVILTLGAALVAFVRR